MRRNEFLKSLAVLAAGPAPAKKLQRLGVQLYTVRSILSEKPLETLRAIEQMGFQEAEVVRASLDKIWESFKQTKLQPVSLHMDTSLFTTRMADLPGAVDDAARRGFQYVVCPYIAPQDRGGVAVIEKLAANLNQAGEKCKSAGLKLAYHNHAFEFEMTPSGTLLDILLAKTDPQLVFLELDIFWAAVAGADPVALFQKYAGRIPLVHVKDVKPGVEKRLDERVPRDAFREVGRGSLPMAQILRAGSNAGVRHFFVEQDQTPGNPLDSLRISAQYLKDLDF
ncbi:MAG: sugar phosphate isomerase/epimerase [Bryobacteraceae bacterium]|nr:sugar phosphate isomerase/epimerase [Bryobacteraceae bacterium]MDW8379670.1 sugar phosphate isomerase/epimerase [Bryobacterales bacterium]